MRVRTLGPPWVTTLWAGSGFVLAAVLQLLGALGVAIPITEESVFPFSSTVPYWVSIVVLLIAACLAAVGVRGE